MNEIFDGFRRYSNGSNKPLPKPDVRVPTSDGPKGGTWTEADVKGMVMSPIYAGVGPYPRLMPEELWVRANAKLLKETLETQSVEQYLVNLLYVLRENLGCNNPEWTGNQIEPIGYQIVLDEDYLEDE